MPHQEMHHSLPNKDCTLPKWASQHQVYILLHKVNSFHGFDGRFQGGSQGMQGVPASQLHPICWLWGKLNMNDVWSWFFTSDIRKEQLLEFQDNQTLFAIINILSDLNKFLVNKLQIIMFLLPHQKLYTLNQLKLVSNVCFFINKN